MIRTLLGRLQWWLATPFRAYDEAHDMDDDVVVPPARVVFEDPAVPHVVARAEALAQALRLDVIPMHHWAGMTAPKDPSCVFCPATATEEIFLGWVADPKGVAAPPTARFARVCINHVGHSRFTRSDRPVDEL